jgi:hypothetical protein
MTEDEVALTSRCLAKRDEVARVELLTRVYVEWHYVVHFEVNTSPTNHTIGLNEEVLGPELRPFR